MNEPEVIEKIKSLIPEGASRRDGLFVLNQQTQKYHVITWGDFHLKDLKKICLEMGKVNSAIAYAETNIPTSDGEMNNVIAISRVNEYYRFGLKEDTGEVYDSVSATLGRRRGGKGERK